MTTVFILSSSSLLEVIYAFLKTKGSNKRNSCCRNQYFFPIFNQRAKANENTTSTCAFNYERKSYNCEFSPQNVMIVAYRRCSFSAHNNLLFLQHV